MRVALKVAYDGTRFSGSQVQPGVRTVHSEVAKGLAALGAEGEPRLLWAGRTDRGVSAAGNVVVVETDHAVETLLPALTFQMEDVWAWAWAEVDTAFEPRHASRRRYRYHLRSDLDAPALQEVLQVFVGTHDFTAFARLEPGVNPRRSIAAMRVAREGRFLRIDVEGPNFLYNQVRRMVEAGRRVASGDLPAEEVRRALASGGAADFGIAPPEPLVLLDVEYDHLRFQVSDALDRIQERLRRRAEERERETRVLRDLLGGGA